MKTNAALAAFGAATIWLVASFPGSAQTPPAPTTPPVAVPAVVVAAPAPADPRTLFSGTYRPEPGPGNHNAIEAGIDHAVSGLFFLVRGIAHGRIAEGNPIFPFIRFAFPPGTIEMYAGNYVVRSPDNGGESTVHGLDNHTNRVTQRFNGLDRLMQVTWNNDGRRQSEYVLSADGHTLLVNILITSDRLPLPVRYTMRYRR